MEELYCYKCGSKVNEKRAIWLELSSETGEFQPSNYPKLPEEESQGYFVFGSDCGKIKVPQVIKEFY